MFKKQKAASDETFSSTETSTFPLIPIREIEVFFAVAVGNLTPGLIFIILLLLARKPTLNPGNCSSKTTESIEKAPEKLMLA